MISLPENLIHIEIGAAVVLLLISIIGPVWQRKAKQRQLALSGINEIDHMPGRVFEEYLAAVFREKGYKVELTPATKDQGGDLVISKRGVRTVVQAKRWKENVSNHAVQEVVAAKPFYRADQAIIVTNSGFTKSAIELARANGVELWGRDKLVRELVHSGARNNVYATRLKGVQYDMPQHDKPSAIDILPTNKTCPICGNKMVVRHRRKDGKTFLGCKSYPKCKHIEDM